MGGLNREDCLDSGALSKRGDNLKFAAKGLYPFFHAYKAKRRYLFIMIGVKPAAVVPDRQQQPVMLPFKRYSNFCGIGVAIDVGERLLKDSEHGDYPYLVQTYLFIRYPSIPIHTRFSAMLTRLSRYRYCPNHLDLKKYLHGICYLTCDSFQHKINKLYCER